MNNSSRAETVFNDDTKASTFVIFNIHVVSCLECTHEVLNKIRFIRITINGRNKIAKHIYHFIKIYPSLFPKAPNCCHSPHKKTWHCKKVQLNIKQQPKREIFTRNLWIASSDLPQHQSQQTRKNYRETYHRRGFLIQLD